MTDVGLGDLAVCPTCRGGLAWSPERASCTTCAAAYIVDDGIPVLLPSRSAGSQKELQAAYFDEETNAEFETTRPHDAPNLYGDLLHEKFRRSVRGLPSLAGARALVVCGGSGMDAEFLARAGASVVSSDLSIGAARRARERASRYGVDVVSIVADAECLPFDDAAFDVVYVHDGLHHLERPLSGLAEMARVAGSAVSVTEPARAAATAAAVRAGLALEREPSGNRVARLTIAEIADSLRTAGFRVVNAQRYAMYYKHEPGRVVRVLSSRPLATVARLGLGLVNIAIGRFGNKLTVQATRSRG